jgi:phosphoglycolate phosphatase-like HAD superfamily hydrolase
MTEVAALVRRARALVFDFDGTLVDSNPVKWQAFEACFAEFPERREEILAYCRGHHAVPRGEKFRHVFEQILERPYTAEAAAALHRRFDALTTAEIAAAPEIAGAHRFVQQARRRGATALLSTTPHDTLLAILDRRGWSEAFGSVRGAPVAKGAWLQAWLAGQGLGPDQAVFFGDTAEDAQAAAAAGCAFVGVGASLGAAVAPLRIADFTGLTEAR